MRDNDSMMKCMACGETRDWCRCLISSPIPPRKGSNPPPTFSKPTPPPNPPPVPNKATARRQIETAMFKYPYFDHNGILYDDPAKRGES